MFRHATSKLCKSSVSKVIYDELALLAIVICRMGLYLNPQSSSTASELVVNYMASLLLCHGPHEHFLVTYLSDPVLTIASAELCYYDREQKDLLVTRGLPILGKQLVHGAVLEGCIGESAGRLLLLLGMDRACESGNFDGK